MFWKQLWKQQEHRFPIIKPVLCWVWVGFVFLLVCYFAWVFFEICTRHTMSNAKVNSSSDFRLAFDLSAALRLPSAACAIPKGPRGCLALHTPANNSQGLSLAEQTRARSWLSQMFPLKRLCSADVFIHRMGPPCAIFFSPVRRKPKPSDPQGSSVSPSLHSSSSWHSHFLGIDTGALPAAGGAWTSQCGDFWTLL